MLILNDYVFCFLHILEGNYWQLCDFDCFVVLVGRNHEIYLLITGVDPVQAIHYTINRFINS